MRWASSRKAGRGIAEAGLLSYPVVKALGLAGCVDLLNADAGLIYMPCWYGCMRIQALADVSLSPPVCRSL